MKIRLYKYCKELGFTVPRYQSIQAEGLWTSTIIHDLNVFVSNRFARKKDADNSVATELYNYLTSINSIFKLGNNIMCFRFVNFTKTLIRNKTVVICSHLNTSDLYNVQPVFLPRDSLHEYDIIVELVYGKTIIVVNNRIIRMPCDMQGSLFAMTLMHLFMGMGATSCDIVN